MASPGKPIEPASAATQSSVASPVSKTKTKKNPLDYCRRYKILSEIPFDNVVLREYDNLDCDGAVLVTGFPTNEGLTPMLTANYLVEQLELPLIGDILSDVFPSTCVVNKFMPGSAVRIYGDKRVVVIASHVRFDDASAEQRAARSTFWRSMDQEDEDDDAAKTTTDAAKSANTTPAATPTKTPAVGAKAAAFSAPPASANSSSDALPAALQPTRLRRQQSSSSSFFSSQEIMVQSLFGALQRGGVSIQSNVPTLRAVRMPGGGIRGGLGRGFGGGGGSVVEADDDGGGDGDEEEQEEEDDGSGDGPTEVDAAMLVKVMRSMVKCIFDFARRHRCRMILSAEGLPVQPSKKKLDKFKDKSQAELLTMLIDEMDGAADPEVKKKKSNKPGSAASAGKDDSDKGKTKSQVIRKKDADAKKGGKGSDKAAADEKKSDAPAVPPPRPEHESKQLYFVTNTEDFGRKLQGLGHKPLKEGVLAGITAGLLAEGMFREQVVGCLLCPYSALLPDSHAAIPIIRTIDRLYNDELHIDLSDLKKKTHEMAQSIRKALEGLKPKEAASGGHSQAPMGMYN